MSPQRVCAGESGSIDLGDRRCGGIRRRCSSAQLAEDVGGRRGTAFGGGHSRAVGGGRRWSLRQTLRRRSWLVRRQRRVIGSSRRLRATPAAMQAAASDTDRRERLDGRERHRPRPRSGWVSVRIAAVARWWGGHGPSAGWGGGLGPPAADGMRRADQMRDGRVNILMLHAAEEKHRPSRHCCASSVAHRGCQTRHRAIVTKHFEMSIRSGCFFAELKFASSRRVPARSRIGSTPCRKAHRSPSRLPPTLIVRAIFALNSSFPAC